jgi:hypothetical protein
MKTNRGVLALILIGYLGLLLSIVAYIKLQGKASPEHIEHAYGWGWLAMGTLLIAISIPPLSWQSKTQYLVWFQDF